MPQSIIRLTDFQKLDFPSSSHQTFTITFHIGRHLKTHFFQSCALSLFRLWRYINHLLANLLTYVLTYLLKVLNY